MNKIEPMNSKSKLPKQSVKHQRCVVCGKNFGSYYDEEMRTYPPFHIEDDADSPNNRCEHYFYKELLYIYMHLHNLQNSVSITQLVKEHSWIGLVVMKKEMLIWCFERGYLNLDNLKRIEIPETVDDTFSNLFNTINLNDEQKLTEAINVLKVALRCMKDELKPVPPEDIPVAEEKFDRGPSRLFDNIDTSQIKQPTDKRGMITTTHTGARDIDKRVTAGVNTLARKRLERGR